MLLSLFSVSALACLALLWRFGGRWPRPAARGAAFLGLAFIFAAVFAVYLMLSRLEETPTFKWVKQPLVPVQGSWVDASHMVALFLLLSVACLLLLRGFGGRWPRRVVQGVGFFVFIFSFHRCLCLVRGAWLGFQAVGIDDLSAYGNLALSLPIVAFTLLAGRVFCGWVCPFGTVLEIMGKLARWLQRHLGRPLRFVLWCLAVGIAVVPTVQWLPSTFRIQESAAAMWAWASLLAIGVAILVPRWDGRLRWVRTILGVIWVTVICLGVFTTNPWCTPVGGELDFSSLTATIILALGGLLVSMAWCRYACPAGAFQGWLSPLALLQVQRVPGEGREADAVACPTAALAADRVRHSECIMCGACVRAGLSRLGPARALVERPPKALQRGKAVALAVAVVCVAAYGVWKWPPPVARRAGRAEGVSSAGEVAPPGSRWHTFAANARRDGLVDVRFPRAGLRRRWKARATDRVWRFQKGAGVWSSAAALARVDGRVLAIVGHYDHNVYAFDVRDGRVAWTFTTAGVPTEAPTITVVGGRLTALVTATNRTLYALDAATGKRLWAFETYPWSDTMRPSHCSSPMVVDVDGDPLVVFSAWSSDSDPLRNLQAGELIGVAPRKPSQAAWRVTLDTVHISSPALAMTPKGPVAVVLSAAGRAFGVDPRNGAKLWDYATVTKTRGSPSVGKIGGRVATFFGDTYGTVYALDAATGEEIWSRRVGHIVGATPVFVNTPQRSWLLVASFDRILHAVDAATGETIWNIETGDYLTATPCIVRLGRGYGVLFWSLDNYLYLADLASGQVLWRDRTGAFLWTHTLRGETLFSSPAAGLDADGRPIALLPGYDGYVYCYEAAASARSGSGTKQGSGTK